MKLAEALQLRADLNRRIDALKSRLSANALVQEGERPAEDPAELLVQLDDCIAQLEGLMTRINHTNCSVQADGVSMTALLAKRDALKLKLDAYRTLVHEAGTHTRRATRSEIKILSAVDIAALQKTVDQLAKELRLLDNRIQQTNWTTELM